MTKGPQRIHHALPDQAGRDVMETLCDILIIPQREGDMITKFHTAKANNPISVLFDPRGVTCNTCHHVWRNIKGEARG